MRTKRQPRRPSPEAAARIEALERANAILADRLAMAQARAARLAAALTEALARLTPYRPAAGG